MQFWRKQLNYSRNFTRLNVNPMGDAKQAPFGCLFASFFGLFTLLGLCYEMAPAALMWKMRMFFNSWCGNTDVNTKKVLQALGINCTKHVCVTNGIKLLIYPGLTKAIFLCPLNFFPGQGHQKVPQREMSQPLTGLLTHGTDYPSSCLHEESKEHLIMTPNRLGLIDPSD